MEKSTVILIIIIVLAMILLFNFIIPPTIEKIQCKEKGGTWENLIGGGCGMSPELCEDAGGTPTGYLQCKGSIFTGCPDIGIDGCKFE